MKSRTNSKNIKNDWQRKVYKKHWQQCFRNRHLLRIVKTVDFLVAVSNAILGFKQSFQGFCNYREKRMIKKMIPGMNINDFTEPEGTIIIGWQKGMKEQNRF